MGFTVSPSNSLKFNRQPLKKVFFYRQPTKMQGNINCQNVSRDFINLTVSTDLFQTSGS